MVINLWASLTKWNKATLLVFLLWIHPSSINTSEKGWKFSYYRETILRIPHIKMSFENGYTINVVFIQTAGLMKHSFLCFMECIGKDMWSMILLIATH